MRWKNTLHRRVSLKIWHKECSQTGALNYILQPLTSIWTRWHFRSYTEKKKKRDLIQCAGDCAPRLMVGICWTKCALVPLSSRQREAWQICQDMSSIQSICDYWDLGLVYVFILFLSYSSFVTPGASYINTFPSVPHCQRMQKGLRFALPACSSLSNQLLSTRGHDWWPLLSLRDREGHLFPYSKSGTLTLSPPRQGKCSPTYSQQSRELLVRLVYFRLHCNWVKALNSFNVFNLPGRSDSRWCIVQQFQIWLSYVFWCCTCVLIIMN